MPLMPRIQFKESATRRAFFGTGIAAWVALVAVLTVIVPWLIRIESKLPRNGIDDINQYVGAEFFAQNFLLVWLGGGPTEAEKLATMTAMTELPQLAADPIQVYNINAVPPVKRTLAGKETEWALTLAATLTTPGTGGITTRSYFRVTFVEAGGTYKALMWPRPVNNSARAVEIAPYYTIGIGRNSPLGEQVANFMTAFYTAAEPATSDKPKEPRSLGSYVTQDFTDTAIKNSPWTEISEVKILAAQGSPDSSTANPGTTINVLVTAKAVVSTDTFNTISAPLRLKLSNNRQWLVDGFDEPIHFGAVKYQ